MQLVNRTMDMIAVLKSLGGERSMYTRTHCRSLCASDTFLAQMVIDYDNTALS